MFYEKIGDDYLIRLEKDEEVVSSILKFCQKQKILSATFCGIGACDNVVLQTYIQEKNDFLNHEKTGLLEMVSLMGNVRLKGENLDLHAHATFSFLDGDKIAVLAGHLKRANISYTAEIRLSAIDKAIKLIYDDKTKIDVWDLKDKI